MTQKAGRQVTFELRAAQDGDRPIYLVGSFNDWNFSDHRYRLSPTDELHRFEIKMSVHPEMHPFWYKYHRGARSEEELTAVGGQRDDRLLAKGVRRQRDMVERWRINGAACLPQYRPIEFVIEEDFEIPQLNKRRRIWALLPSDYHDADVSYPVLYLQDAQNLFSADAPFGNWAIDEKLGVLKEQGLGDVVIVAIEHGGTDRLKEFSPFETEQFGAGEGLAYATFLKDTLKPYVDNKFRTKPHRIYTGIGGSSMGGLISVFAGMKYPDVFGKWMIFSPSFWLSSEIFTNARQYKNDRPTFVYLYGGRTESKSMESDLIRFTEILRRKSLNDQLIHYHLTIHPTAGHNEQAWGDAFPDALKWLYHDRPQVAS